MKDIWHRYPVRELTTSQKSAVARLRTQLVDGTLELQNILCPICSSGRSKVLFTNDRYDINVNTVVCTRCGLTYTNPVMTDESAKRFYESDLYRAIYGGTDKTAAEMYERRFDFDLGKQFNVASYSANECFYLFVEKSKIEYDTVCEIGAGGGWNLAPFMKAGKQAIGYEPGKFLVELGRKKGINLIRGFVEDIEGTYDLVILRHVLEHFTDPLAALEEIRKHTAQYLAVEVPGIVDSIPSIQNAHVLYLSLNTLTKLLSMAGFKVCEIDYFRSNNFVIAIFEKTDRFDDYSYNFRKEFLSMMGLYYRDRARCLTSQLMKQMNVYGLYSFLKTRLQYVR